MVFNEFLFLVSLHGSSKVSTFYFRHGGSKWETRNNHPPTMGGNLTGNASLYGGYPICELRHEKVCKLQKENPSNSVNTRHLTHHERQQTCKTVHFKNM